MTKHIAKLVIAGPGAGKTHNMVESILEALPELLPAKYMAVITYTNSAANNIYVRLSKKISIPENLFIGTMHSFLNKFVVIPFATFGNEKVAKEKLFLQCDLDTVLKKVVTLNDSNQRNQTPQKVAILKSKIRKRLNERGYITFDQTLSIANDCVSNPIIIKSLSNRLQFLFVDEFQDSGNKVFNIIENIRKQNKTKIYCVGDPEQYIQSFDSFIKLFQNIPILKASISKNYQVEINYKNFRSTQKIVSFLNRFNERQFKAEIFRQEAICKQTHNTAEVGEDILFVNKYENITSIIKDFYAKCDSMAIPMSDRCILAKKNDVVKRIIAAVGNHYMNPKKETKLSPMKVIQDALLSTLQMNQTEFCLYYQTTIYTLRKYSVAIFKAINDGTITTENSFVLFVKDKLKLEVKQGLPVKVDNLKYNFNHNLVENTATVSNIHTIKGLESKAVLAIAKTEEELLLWIETKSSIRDSKRDNEKTDYPRLGYVAFSRAEKLLCIACLQKVSTTTLEKLNNLNVQVLY